MSTPSYICYARETFKSVFQCVRKCAEGVGPIGPSKITVATTKVRSAALSEANSIGKKSVAVLVNHMDTSYKRRFGCYFSSSVETRDRPNEMLIFESKHFENKNAALQRRKKRYTSVHQTGGYPSNMSVDLEHHTSACKMSSAQ